MLKFNPTTPLLFYSKESVYISGSGAQSTWNKVVDCFLYCEWRGSFGDRAIAAQAQGVKESATIRMSYHPDVYRKLVEKQVVIIKNIGEAGIKGGSPDKNNPNVYELWGGVDNIEERNQFMEFKVRRYEGK